MYYGTLDPALADLFLEMYLTPGWGPRKYQQLLIEAGSLESLCDSFREVKTKFSIPDIPSQSIVNLKKELQEFSIKYVTCEDTAYPKMLRQISDFPLIVFFCGNIDILNNGVWVSVVGSRKMSSDGQRWTKSLVEPLAAQGVGIISGLAFGVDSEAHKAALKSKGRTVAVLAGSPHEAIPPRNQFLYREILERGGCVLSEYTPSTKVMPGMFARRNRLIAGLSTGTVIVEAGKDSGALITANLAFDYNRLVWAVPGDIERELSQGSNMLIKQSKAQLVQTTEDILRDLQIEPVSDLQAYDMSELTDTQKQMLECLGSGGKLLDELAGEVDISIGNALSLLTGLELSGWVSVGNDQRYKLTRVI